MKNKSVIKATILLLIMSLLFCSCSISSSTKEIISGTDAPSNAQNGSIEGLGNNFLPENREVISFDTNDNGDFKILQLSDTHIFSATKKKDIKTLEAIKTSISDVKPDLVVVLGDMIDGYNDKEYYNKKEALHAIATMFEEMKTYWAYVPGNNDGEYLGTNNDVLAYLSNYSHCIFSKTSGIDGDTQYVIDLKNNNDVVHSLIFLDTGGKDENKNYDCIPQSELDWLSKTLSEKSNMCSIFMHMNTPSFSLAGANGEPYSSSYKPVEKIKNSIPDNNAFDEIVDKSKKVSLVSIGHLHPKNNECSFYNNIYYHITMPTGFEKSDKPSASVVTIHTLSKDTKNMYDFDITKLKK